MQIYKTEPEFLNEVRARAAGAAAEDVAAAIEAGVRDGEREVREDMGDAEGLNLRIGTWVLRDKDLPVLNVIGMIGAAVVAIFAPGPVLLASAVAGVTAFSRTAWTAWRKSTRITQDEIAVLGVLQVGGPMLQEDLEQKVVQVLPDLTVEDVRRSILSLTDLESVDGDLIELIRRDASDRWRIR